MCQVYGTPPPLHVCVVGICVPKPDAPTVKITLPPPLLDSQWGATATFPVDGYCEKHGTGYIVEARSSAGFTGAPIYWETLSCGCQEVDASADNIEAVR